MTKAVFFDRDGVVNERIKGGYVTNWSTFRFLPDIGSMLAHVKAKGYLAVIITNQRGVGLGLMTQQDLDAIHQQMQDELLRTAQVQFDDIIFCTDATDDSPRRKPSPVMILEAARKWDIDLSHSWLIGDSPTDIAAGNAAGVKTAFLLNAHEMPPNDATILVENVLDMLTYL